MYKLPIIKRQSKSKQKYIFMLGLKQTLHCLHTSKQQYYKQLILKERHHLAFGICAVNVLCSITVQCLLYLVLRFSAHREVEHVSVKNRTRSDRPAPTTASSLGRSWLVCTCLLSRLSELDKINHGEINNIIKMGDFETTRK